MMLQPSRAPERAASGAPPPPAAPAAPGTATAPDAPPGVPGDPGPFGGLGMMLPMLLIVFGLFFFMNRSEKKKRAKLEGELKKGDKVLTRAGFICKLVEVGETRCRVELAPGVVITVVKQAIEWLAYDEVKKIAKADDKDADKDADDKAGKKKKKK